MRTMGKGVTVIRGIKIDKRRFGDICFVETRFESGLFIDFCLLILVVPFPGSSNLTAMSHGVMRFGVLVAALGGSTYAQTTLHTTTTLVVVPTVVQTQEKTLVFSLTGEDFVLTDNGIPQKVTLEEETKRPLSLVVLIQTGGIARGQFLNYKNLEAMLEEILGKGPNEASIVNFDSRIEGVSPFTTDITQWREAIDKPDQGNSGAAIFDSIEYGLGLLKKEPVGNRRAILLISQEHDGGSTISMKELVRDLGESNTAVYSVTFSAEKTKAKLAFKDPPHLNPPLPMLGGTQGYAKLDEPLRLIFGAMQKNLSAEVANLSGGDASSFDNRSELDEALSRVGSHLRNSYILSFSPTSTKPGLHTIKVQLTHHPDLVVSARSNYWASDQGESVTNP
jgi:VWFA-related protein